MSAANRRLFGRDSRGALPTESILRLAVWCAFLVVISFTSADPDLWGHVRFGLDILRDANRHGITVLPPKPGDSDLKRSLMRMPAGPARFWF